MTAVALAPLFTDEPTYCSVTASVTGGLDGAQRVLTLLRGRGYRVRDLHVQVDEGRVTCAVLLTPADLDLMLARLRRLPSVVSAVG